MFFKVLLFLIPVFFITSSYPETAPKAEAAGDKAESHDAAGKKKKDYSQMSDAELKEERKRFILPRYLYLPKVLYLESLYSPTIIWPIKSTNHFQVLFLFSSWNDASKSIARILNDAHPKLVKRSIEVLGLFSFDTQQAMDSWIREERPLFKTGVASMDFIDAADNPKIPTIWVVNYENAIHMKLEMPTPGEVQDMVNSLYKMADF